MYSALIFVSLATDFGSLARYALVTGFSLVLISVSEKWDKALVAFGAFAAILNMLIFVVGTDKLAKP